MRLWPYSLTSTLLTGLTLSAVYHQRKNFFAAGIHVYKSSACLIILLNQLGVLVVLWGKLLLRLFFGALRTMEVEHLYERSWFAVTETCLALTVFRDDFDIPFLLVFVTLLFLKIFHWVLQDRVDYMEQAPQQGKLFHFRLVILFSLLFLSDLAHIAYAWKVALVHSSWILFGFEYAILVASLLGVLGRYILNCIDLRREEPWEDKSAYLFYLDLIIDFVKLVAYVGFFLVVVNLFGLPLHILRELYLTFRSFTRRLQDLRRYHQATRDLQLRYPTVSAAELQTLPDRICVVCREEMQGGEGVESAKRLGCGHIFHFRCLRNWLERQQSCPTCRRSLFTTPPPPPAPAPIPPPPSPPLQHQQQHQSRSIPQTRGEATATSTGTAGINLSQVEEALPDLIPLFPFSADGTIAGVQGVESFIDSLTEQELLELHDKTTKSLRLKLRLLLEVDQQIHALTNSLHKAGITIREEEEELVLVNEEDVEIGEIKGKGKAL